MTLSLTQPFVTIAIPTFNRLRYLKEAVASALAQTYGNIEILIGDDGGTEAIRQWGEALAQREPRVRYQRNPCNLGLAGNWNALADAARGDFIVIIGDDDRLLPDFVDKLLKTMPSDAQMGFTNHYLINSLGERLEAESQQQTREYRRDLLSAGEIIDAEACVWRNSVPMSAALARTADIRRLRFKEDLNTPEIELFLRLAREGGRFFFLPEYLAEYRVHPQSATAVGLRGENLAQYLLPVKVSQEIEPIKRRFMEALLLNSVGDCLRQRKREMALELFSSEYYPRPFWRHAKGWIHWLCLRLPSFLGLRLYQHLLRLKSASGIIRRRKRELDSQEAPPEKTAELTAQPQQRTL
jgi:glycosyltransferase involved in cell wall biosynthesis